MAKKRYASGGITISMGGGQSSDGVFGEKAASGNPYPFPNGNAGNAAPSSDSSGTSQTFNIQPSASASPTSDNSSSDNSDQSKAFKRGGKVKSSASHRGDGIAQRGKTRGRYL